MTETVFRQRVGRQVGFFHIVSAMNTRGVMHRESQNGKSQKVGGNNNARSDALV